MDFAECQQSSSTSSFYASGPNDIWSLGIILVNLTCGRNPWKRASIDDSTFRAYLKNPRFLSSILPLSPELDSILRRIFECDPRRRISIHELRNLIVRCPNFTSRPSATPPSPPPESSFGQVSSFQAKQDLIQPSHQYPTAPYSPAASPSSSSNATSASGYAISPNGSVSSDEGSVFSDTSNGSTPAEGVPSGPSPLYVPSQPINYYGNIIPLDPFPKVLGQPQMVQTVRVC